MGTPDRQTPAGRGQTQDIVWKMSERKVKGDKTLQLCLHYLHAVKKKIDFDIKGGEEKLCAGDSESPAAHPAAAAPRISQ